MGQRTTPNQALLAGLGIYLLWAAATWLLEGRIETLLRPEARADRLVYAVVANLLIGVGGTSLVLHHYRHALDAGAREGRVAVVVRGLAWISVGAVAGGAFYMLRGAPSTDPVVILNAFSQVLTVSAAEVLVCWALVGRAIEASVKPRGRAVALILAMVAASALFGVYHFAHSAPFNSIKVVSQLSLVGLLTSAFFFSSRSVTGTIVFHNFLGTLGVVQALKMAGTLATFEQPQLLLLGTALVTAAIVAAGYYWLPARGARRRAQSARPQAVND